MPRSVIVIAAGEQNAANVFCNSIGAEGETFTVPLFTKDTHTHYWCNWLMNEQQQSHCDSQFTQLYDTPNDALTVLGLNTGKYQYQN